MHAGTMPIVCGAWQGEQMAHGTSTDANATHLVQSLFLQFNLPVNLLKRQGAQVSVSPSVRADGVLGVARQCQRAALSGALGQLTPCARL